MSDIVERLKEYAEDDHERGCAGRCYDCSCGYDGKRDPLLNEAADEIERLRAALREIDEIGRVAAQVPGPRNKLMEICARARAAMGGGDE